MQRALLGGIWSRSSSVRSATRCSSRWGQPKRRRAAGGGHPFTLSFRAQLLLVVVWLRVYPTSPVLGFLFGISHPTVLRTIARVLPILEQAGRDTMRLPGHGERGRRSRRSLNDLLGGDPGAGGDRRYLRAAGAAPA